MENHSLPGAPPRAMALSTSSAIISSPNWRRRKIIITNDSAEIIYLARGESASANAGIRLNANGGTLIDAPDVYGRMYYGPWAAVAASGSPALLISEE